MGKVLQHARFQKEDARLRDAAIYSLSLFIQIFKIKDLSNALFHVYANSLRKPFSKTSFESGIKFHPASMHRHFHNVKEINP
jgi:hypothetical protein